jgi:transcription termination factor Rho
MLEKNSVLFFVPFILSSKNSIASVVPIGVKIFILRKILTPMGTTEAMEFLLDKMNGTKNNTEFFSSMGKNNN